MGRRLDQRLIFHTDIDRLIGSLKRHLNSLAKATTDEEPGHAASEAEQRKELKRLLGEAKLKREEEKNQNGFPDANIKLENEEKARKQSELHSRDRGKKRWAAMVFLPIAVLAVAGASWYFFVQYMEQVEATNAALVEIQKKAADAEAKQQAEAKRAADALAAAKLEADAKRQAEAIAEAVAKAEADVEARLKAEADAEAQLKADADAEAELKVDAEAKLKAEADAKLDTGTDAEASRRADATDKSRLKTQANTFFREGLSLAGYGDYEAAIQNYDEAIRLSPPTSVRLQTTGRCIPRSRRL